MKFMHHFLAALVLVSSTIAALENGVLLGESFGEPHGKKYSDLDVVVPGQTAQSITLRTAKRVDAVILEITGPSGITSVLHHGGTGGDAVQHSLREGEYITSWEAQWGDDGDRIEYIVFGTNRPQAQKVKYSRIMGDTPTGNAGKDDALVGFQLGGFIGYWIFIARRHNERAQTPQRTISYLIGHELVEVVNRN